MGLISESVDRKVMARAAEVPATRSSEGRKKALIKLGHGIHEFVSAIEKDAGQASGQQLVELIERHYRVRSAVFKVIGLLPPSLNAQGLALARRLSEVELGLRPGKPRKGGKPARKRKARARKPSKKARHPVKKAAKKKER